MMGYSREGDVVTLSMSINDYDGLIFTMGMATGYVFRHDREMLKVYLALFDRLNAGNPNWTPYDADKSGV